MKSISKVKNGIFQAPTNTGNLSISTGFSPDLLLFKATNTITSIDGAENSFGGSEYGWLHGLADLNSGKELSIFSGTGSQSTNGCAIESSTSYCINIPDLANDGNNISTGARATVQQDTDGFTLNFSNVSQADYIKYKAYKFNVTGDYDIGMSNCPPSTSTVSIDTNFTPNFVRFVGQPVLTNKDETIQHSGQWGLSHGWCNNKNEYGISFASYSNNVDDHVWMSRTGSSATIVHETSKGGITGKTTGSTSFTDNGFDISFSEVDGSEELFMWLAIKADEEIALEKINTPTENNIKEVKNRFKEIEFVGNATINTLSDNDSYSGSNQNSITYGWTHGSVDEDLTQSVLSTGVSSNSVNAHRSVGSNSEAIRMLFTDSNANNDSSDDATVSELSYYKTNIDFTGVSTSSDAVESSHLENPIVLWGVKQKDKQGTAFL